MITIIERICGFFSSFFGKKETKTMIAESIEPRHKLNSENLIKSIKSEQTNVISKPITLICDGDGLGIQSKITY